MDINKEYDFCVVITTYNRPKSLYQLLDNILSCKKDYNVYIFVFDDGSTENYDLQKYDVKYIKQFKNHGKKLFWKTIDRTFKFIKNINSKYYVYLQDDLILCDNFLTKIKNLYENINDDNKICLEFRTDNRTTKSNWTGIEPIKIGDYIKTQWVELDFICKKNFFECLNYNLNEIPLYRWDNNESLSSGVGEQLSIRLLTLGKNMYHTKISMVSHGHQPSIMNPNERRKNPLISNF